MVQMQVKVTGPLASGEASMAVRQAVEAAIREITETGTNEIKDMARPRPGGVFLSAEEAGKRASKGHYRRSIHNWIGSLSGLITDGGVIYGPWLEGVGSRNLTTRFKGYAMFRRTRDALQKRVPQIVERHIARAVSKANGP